MRHNKIIQLPFSLIVGVILAFSMSCTTSNAPDNQPSNPPASSTGLNVSVVTSTAGGGYAPKHVFAIWIENSAGTFIKTLVAYAKDRDYDLTAWKTSSMGNTIDAVTGATQSSNGTISGTWNGTDVSGKVVADGTYRVCMELTDKGTTGNFSFYTFTKGASTVTVTPPNAPSFSSVSIKWVPLQ